MNYEQFTHTINNKTKKIFLVDMKKELNYHFSELVKEGITKYIKNKKNIVILVNKKWFASWVICRQCWYIPQCSNCSVNISYHEDVHKQSFWLCHICKTQYDIPKTCPQCSSDQITPYGMGVQQVAERVQEEYKIIPTIIDSEKNNSPNKIQKTQTNIKEWSEATVMIGTSLLTTPLKHKTNDLVIFLNADIWLNIPDYTAAEKNFYFLYEALHNYQTANFIIQSFNPEQYSIRNACKMDPEAFTQQDNIYREKLQYPPYSDLCVLLYKHDIEERLYANVDKLYKELLYYKEKYKLEDLQIYTTPPLIYKKFWKYRYNIVLKWQQLRNFLDIVYTKCNITARWFKVDRQADSII